MMVLYRTDLVGGDVDEAIAGFEGEHGFEMPEYSQQLVRGVSAELDQVDASIQANLHERTLDRLGAVERAVLRIAMWELTDGNVPAPVAIDEAVELAKRYATPDAAKLVNGVLAGWLRANDSDPDLGKDT